MTATIVIENANLYDTVTISSKASGTGGSRLGLKTGDIITVHDLLYGLLLCSGNDAAVALAEYVCGSVAEFAQMMNNKAEELGLTSTHFVTPHGLDNEDHYTTAYELAILADYALQNETFANIVNTKKYTVSINGYSKALSNTNELLRRAKRCIRRKNRIYKRS
jgi:D-alanyl-D-alanine carboxypeptidase